MLALKALRTTRAVLLAAALLLIACGSGSEPRSPDDGSLPDLESSSPESGHEVLPWAFVLNDSSATPASPADPEEIVSVPESSVSLRRSAIRIDLGPPDWHPESHPPMPAVVARGGSDGVLACGYCHLPNGQGKPENAGLAGQPRAYLEQQMADYRNGLRRTGEPRMGPPTLMVGIGAAASEEESRIAAAYFSSIAFRPWIRVIEVDEVPRTRFAGWIHEVVDGAGTEPIGVRVVEVPEDPDRTRLRDDASGFVAYVPTGSIERGRALVQQGGADGVPCTVCHGDDLRGLGPMPALAGRSPSYLARQLHDFRKGNRAGAWSGLMAGAVAELTVEDIVNIVAYAASLDP